MVDIILIHIWYHSQNDPLDRRVANYHYSWSKEPITGRHEGQRGEAEAPNLKVCQSERGEREFIWRRRGSSVNNDSVNVIYIKKEKS